MKALIIGASGLVGGNFLRLYKEREDYEVIGTHRSTSTEHTMYFDTLELSKRRNFDYGRFNPDVIVHTGAMTHVDACEKQPDMSRKHTVESAKNMAKIANMFNAKLVYISSDYVFNGDHGPYDEKAKPNPVSIYGQHKLEAEEAIKGITRNYIILRITNVYGDELRGKNFIARLVASVEKNRKMALELPYDQYATPVNARDVARAGKRLVDSDKHGIFHIAGTDYMNRVQLASKVLSYFPGHRIHVTPITTNEMGQDARRPLQGGLKSHKFLADFPDFTYSSVDDYMQNVIIPRQKQASIE